MPVLEQGGEAPIDDGDEQVGANGGAGAALGDMAVDVLEEAQALGEVKESGNAAEVADEGAGSGGNSGIGAFGNCCIADRTGGGFSDYSCR